MAPTAARREREGPRRLPRGRHALAPEEVRADQRRRLVEAVPGVVAARGYEATSVADVVKAAAVSRNAFYENFADKEECVAAAHEACHERLLGVLEERCERGMSSEERVETALGGALAMLAAEPEVGCLLFVEAPGAGREIALRHHEWLRRYGNLLGSSIPVAAGKSSPAAEIEPLIVGGIASQVGAEILRGRAGQLRQLIPTLVIYVLAFCAVGEPSEAALAAEAEPAPGGGVAERRRRVA